MSDSEWVNDPDAMRDELEHLLGQAVEVLGTMPLRIGVYAMRGYPAPAIARKINFPEEAIVAGITFLEQLGLDLSQAARPVDGRRLQTLDAVVVRALEEEFECGADMDEVMEGTGLSTRVIQQALNGQGTPATDAALREFLGEAVQRVTESD